MNKRGILTLTIVYFSLAGLVFAEPDINKVKTIPFNKPSINSNETKEKGSQKGLDIKDLHKSKIEDLKKDREARIKTSNDRISEIKTRIENQKQLNNTRRSEIQARIEKQKVDAQARIENQRKLNEKRVQDMEARKAEIQTNINERSNRPESVQNKVQEKINSLPNPKKQNENKKTSLSKNNNVATVLESINGFFSNLLGSFLKKK